MTSQPFHPLEGPARATRLGLFLAVPALLLEGWVNLDRLSLLKTQKGGRSITQAELDAFVDFEAISTLIGAIHGLFLIVAFLIWFNRAYRNLNALGHPRLNFGRGWAIGGWFVPFLNFVRPYQIAQEIFRLSDPKSELGQYDSSTITVWWSLWMGSAAISGFIGFVWLGEAPLSSQITGYQLLMGTRLMTLVSIFFALKVVSELTARQTARRAHPPGLADVFS